jgi:hypothetical protein
MEPADHVGFIGRNADDEHRYVVTGDSGQGITNGVIASMLIANLIIDGRSPWTEVYEPARTITKNIGEYLSENLTVLKSLAEYLQAADVAAVEDLKAGEGRIFRSGLKKVAACRDREGRLHECTRAVLGLPLSRLAVRSGRRRGERSGGGTAGCASSAEAQAGSRGMSAGSGPGLDARCCSTIRNGDPVDGALRSATTGAMLPSQGVPRTRRLRGSVG